MLVKLDYIKFKILESSNSTQNIPKIIEWAVNWKTKIYQNLKLTI